MADDIQFPIDIPALGAADDAQSNPRLRVRKAVSIGPTVRLNEPNSVLLRLRPVVLLVLHRTVQTLRVPS
eukprot:SAG22_NODE_15208_length_354_cov_0.964706_1_plen_69_part_10